MGRVSHPRPSPSPLLLLLSLLAPLRRSSPTRLLAVLPTRGLSTMSTWNLQFDNRNLRGLPVDPEGNNYCRSVPNAIFSRVKPDPVLRPTVVAWSPAALSLLGMPEVTESEIAEILSGNRLLTGSDPAAHCYCGHQFGSFAGQLGDGAAILLGEVLNPNTHERWELQLKGAGKTPYSRSADGRKVLRSSIREFLCSEAMHNLGIPTTRAAACVTSSSKVERDPFYDGNVVNEQCTVVSRLAPNFFRFGSFEIFKPADPKDGVHARSGPSAGNTRLKQQLLDHMMLYYPQLGHLQGVEQYVRFLEELTRRTAKLVAQWQCVGFVHGVLNTDNLSLMGLTIDYGPYGFMEQFDPAYVPNGSDAGARYCYSEQSKVCAWNLRMLAQALAPLVPLDVGLRAVSGFDDSYTQEYLRLMRSKLGLLADSAEDLQLVEALFETMQSTHADFTDSFVALTEYMEDVVEGRRGAEGILVDKLTGRSAAPAAVAAHFKRKMRIHRLGMHPSQIDVIWSALQGDGSKAKAMFGADAPIEDLRAEIAGEKRKLDILMDANKTIKQYEVMKPAVKAANDRTEWQRWVTSYVRRLGVEGVGAHQQRLSTMRKHNPTVVLRNWMAQTAIESAEKGEFEATRALQGMLETPFEPRFSTFKHNRLPNSVSSSDHAPHEELPASQRAFVQLSPEWADSLLCTCSS